MCMHVFCVVCVCVYVCVSKLVCYFIWIGDSESWRMGRVENWFEAFCGTSTVTLSCGCSFMLLMMLGSKRAKTRKPGEGEKERENRKKKSQQVCTLQEATGPFGPGVLRYWVRPLDGQRSAFIMHSEEKTNYNNIHSVLLTLQERVHVKQHVTRTMEPCSTSHLERRGRKRDSLSGDSSLKRERERERERRQVWSLASRILVQVNSSSSQGQTENRKPADSLATVGNTVPMADLAWPCSFLSFFFLKLLPVKTNHYSLCLFHPKLKYTWWHLNPSRL